MSAASPLLIRPFTPPDQQAACALILAGMEEHWGQLDPTKNPDLQDIGATFASGVFLTAWQDGQLIGTGGWQPVDAETVQVMRMSVARAARRSGIGRLILNELLQQARERGCRRVVLETTADWDDAVAFYLRNGFRQTHLQDGDAYFIREL